MRRRLQRWVFIVLSLMLAVLAAGGLAALGRDSTAIPLASVPEGVSAHEVNGRQVFLVRDRAAITGLLRASPRGHGLLVWCTKDDVFLAPATGETFDRQGRLIRDVSPRDMDRVRVGVSRGSVHVEATDGTKGRSHVEDNRFVRDPEPRREWQYSHGGREPPVDFCSGTIP